MILSAQSSCSGNSIWEPTRMGRCCEWINATIKRALRGGFSSSLSVLCPVMIQSSKPRGNTAGRLLTSLQNYGNKSLFLINYSTSCSCDSNTNQLRHWLKANNSNGKEGCMRTDEKYNRGRKTLRKNKIQMPESQQKLRVFDVHTRLMKDSLS